MATRISHEELMRYLDGELSAERRAAVEREIESSTELRRELRVYEAMKRDFQELTFHELDDGHDMWSAVSRRVARPIGWVLVGGGALFWLVYGSYLFATSATDPFEKLAVAAIAIGIVLLLASVAWEQYQDWIRSPYKDVQR